ncbi:MAG: hypothetical protein RIF41_27370 [Polyangiaceae bacterium]
MSNVTAAVVCYVMLTMARAEICPSCDKPEGAADAVDVGTGKAWFVGVTDTPLDTLRRHGVHANGGADACKLQLCTSARVARAALRLLVQRGYRPSMANLDGRWLYVYRIESWTVEDEVEPDGVAVEIVVLAETPFSSTGVAHAESVVAAESRVLLVSGPAAAELAATEPPFDLIVRGDPVVRYRGCGPARPSGGEHSALVPFQTAERV